MKLICHTSAVNPSQLIKQICYPKSLVFTANKWGCTHEESSRKCYEDCVRNHTAILMLVIVALGWPYIGATPDGTTSCTCCGVGIVEIKCSLTESEISKMLLKTRNFACKRDWMASYIWIIHMLTILSSSDTAIHCQCRLWRFLCMYFFTESRQWRTHWAYRERPRIFGMNPTGRDIIFIGHLGRSCKWADRGFYILNSVSMMQAQLYITKGKTQLSELEVHDAWTIANVRIHMERVIGNVSEIFVSPKF